MASQSRKYRGYESQRIVAERLRELYPLAEPTGAGRQGLDILAVPDLDIEVKAQANLSIPAFIRQAKKNSGSGMPVLWLRLNGQGPVGIDDWPVVLTTKDFMGLLRKAGYGVPSVPDRSDP